MQEEKDDKIDVRKIRDFIGCATSTLTDNGLPPSGLVSQDEAIKTLTVLSVAKGRWARDKADKAKELLDLISGSLTELPNVSNVPDVNSKPLGNETPKPSPSNTPNNIGKKPKEVEVKHNNSGFANMLLAYGFLSVTMTVGFLAQLYHTIEFALLCILGDSKVLDNPLPAIVATLMAVSIDLTALTVSVRTSKIWFLAVPLILHVVIIFLVYSPMDGGLTTGRIILSVAVSLANFSYSELFISSLRKS